MDTRKEPVISTGNIEEIAVQPDKSPNQEERTEAVYQPLGEKALSDVVVVDYDDTPQVDDIPALFPLIKRITSANQHRHDSDNDAFTMSRHARALDEHLRTPSQKMLLKDMEDIKRFVPFGGAFTTVYTPEELHDLVEKLTILSEKNRPDFNGIEEELVDYLSRMINSKLLDIRGDTKEVESLKGIIKRATANKEGRRGMRWDTLNKCASAASKLMRKADEASHRGNTMSDYYVKVKDPDPKSKADLSPVYQFVADTHAIQVYGNRVTDATARRQEDFVENCSVINQWYEQVASVLDKLPSDLVLKGQRFRVVPQLGQLIQTMNERLNGNESHGVRKSYRYDVAGAMKLQYLIAHTVDDLRAWLEQDSNREEFEIIPLD